MQPEEIYWCISPNGGAYCYGGKYATPVNKPEYQEAVRASYNPERFWNEFGQLKADKKLTGKPF